MAGVLDRRRPQGPNRYRRPANQRITTVLAERLQAAGVRAPAQAAHAILVFLLGAIQDQALNDGQAPHRIREHIAALAGLDHQHDPHATG